jgi:hypothetical protein
MAKNTAVNPFVNLVKISPQAQEALKQYLLQAKMMAWQNWPIREQMMRVDREYAREMDWTEEGRKASIAVARGDSNKFRNITVPVVLPHVEAAVTYQASVFLTGVPLFGIVSSPNLMGPAKQLETIIDNQAIRGGWTDEFIMFFRDGEKYNFGVLEAEWTREMVPGFDTDISSQNNSARIQPIAWDGNRVNRWDPYNTFWDVRYETAKVSKFGEFCGVSEMVSRVELKKDLITNPAIITSNIKAALESPTPAVTVTGDSSILTYFIPQISKSRSVNPALLGQFNWLAWAGLEKGGTQIEYKNIYMRTKMYARIIPSDFGIDVPGRNTPQVWKFIWVNDSVLVYAQPVSTAFDTMPVFMSAPNRDGLTYQTKSAAQNSVDFQNVTSAMMNSVVAARRRAISDRVLYDPSRISPEQINSDNPSAKIPVRPAAYGKNIQESVYQFPYNDNQSQLMFGEIQQLLQMADSQNGINKARQGQFVKGNKTRQEFDTVMANSNGRDQLKSMVYECQVFTPLKETLKNNVLEKQTPATMYSRELQAPIKIDPVELRKASLQFKVSDGLIPSEKLISGDVLENVLQTVSTAPALGAGYNIAPMFSYLIKTQGADLTPFEKSQAQIAFEGAMAQWQKAVEQLSESFKVILKGTEPGGLDAAIKQFQASLPAQPKPQDYGYNPAQNPITANTDPTGTIAAQVAATLNPQQSQTTPNPGIPNGNSKTNS